MAGSEAQRPVYGSVDVPLHAAGYRTRWSEIPPAVTPMNRVIAGWPEPT